MRDGWGLIEDHVKGVRLADLLAPGEERLEMLIEKKNVNDRWVWTGEYAGGNEISKSPPPSQSQYQHQMQLIEYPGRVLTRVVDLTEDSDEEFKKAIQLSLQSAQVRQLYYLCNQLLLGRSGESRERKSERETSGVRRKSRRNGHRRVVEIRRSVFGFIGGGSSDARIQ